MFCIDIHLPAGQLGSETRILTPLADGQRKLVFAHQNSGPAPRFVDLKAFQLRGGQSVGQIKFDLGIPANDVDLLVVQFADNILHPLPAQPHAGAYRVHFFVTRIDCQLGAKTGFPSDSFDLDGSVIDLGNFQLEQLDDKLGIGAGKNDLRPMRAIFDRLHEAANAFSNLVFLGRHPLAVWQQGFILSQIHRDIGPLETAHRSADDISDPILELRENELLLGSADVLHEGLLGVLRGDPSEVRRSDLHFEFISKLGLGIDPASVKHRDLVMLRKHFFGNHQFGESPDVARLLIDGAPKLASRANGFLGRRKQGFLHGRHEDIAADTLLSLPEL